MRKSWKDPVWSKIIGRTFALVLVIIVETAIMFWDKIPIINKEVKIKDAFKLYEVIIIIIVFILFLLLIKYLIKVSKKAKKKVKKKKGKRNRNYRKQKK